MKLLNLYAHSVLQRLVHHQTEYFDRLNLWSIRYKIAAYISSVSQLHTHPT